MINFILNFFYGMYFSFTSIIYFKSIVVNLKFFKIYSKIVLTNLIFLSFLSIFFEKCNNYLLYITNDTYFIFLIYIFNLINFIIMYILIYPFTYIWSLDGFGNLFNTILTNDNKIHSYEKINEKIYFAVLGIILYNISYFIYFIPVIGYYLGIIYLSYCYSFFCLDYGAQFNSISNYDRLIVLENDPIFFLGFGIPYGLFANYLNQFHFSTVFSIFFPLSVISLSKNYHFKKKINNTHSIIFYIPVLILKFLLLCLSNILNFKYNITNYPVEMGNKESSNKYKSSPESESSPESDSSPKYESSSIISESFSNKSKLK